MAMDVKHGYVRRAHQPFQRKSQQQTSQSISNVSERKVSAKIVAGLVLVLSASLMGGYFIVEHFMQKTFAVQPKFVVPQKVEASVSKNKGVNQSKDEVLPSIQPSKKVLHYTFYEGLKASEVVVEAEPISVVLQNPHYILAGTFGSQKIALQEQRRLKRLGQTLNLREVRFKKTYYRLSAGPFFDRLSLNKKKNELHRLGVDTQVIKRIVKQPSRPVQNK